MLYQVLFSFKLDSFGSTYSTVQLLFFIVFVVSGDYVNNDDTVKNGSETDFDKSEIFSHFL